LQFLYPIWLTAIAGIIVPIAIHLWNVRQGKILEVGTTRFMEQSQKKRASNLRISEWLLLLLRCLTILLFAMVMAGPIWNKSADADEKGWLLIPPNEMKEAYLQKSGVIDSLLKNGYRLHAFEAGFSSMNLSDSVKNNIDTDLQSTNSNYWMLASELAASTPSGLEIAIISSNQLRYFKGRKPTINRQLNWVLFNDTTSTKTTITNAWQTSKDSIGVLIANASSKSIEFGTHFISLRNILEKEFTFKETKGRQTISYKNQQPILIDTNTLRINIYTDRYITDASYVTASMQAIKEFTKRKIRFEVFKTMEVIPQESDLLFWLSDLPVPTKFPGTIVSYKNGTIQKEPGFIYGMQAFSENPIELYQYIASEQKNLLNIWENGKGNPILAIDQLADNRYLLFTHFNPSWNNLVWTNRFAEWMLPFVFNGLPLQTVVDSRIIDPNQVQFNKVDNSSIPKNAIAKNTKPLSNIFWLLLVLVFALERILSFTSKNKTHV
jgi:hypothetical protein